MSKRHILFRVSLWGLVLMACFMVVNRGSSYYRHAAEVTQQEVDALPTLPDITSRDRILVFSPHPDDETLACSGLIQKAHEAGAALHIAFMTNGDAFRAEMQVLYKTVRITPQISRQFGLHRQTEALNAVKQSGVSEDQVTFLGYPDKGLMPIWEKNWVPSGAYLSAFTKTRVNPYENSPSAGLTYCGQNLLHDVETLLREYKPNKVFVVMPGDDHSDHAGTTMFVTAALARLVKEKAPFTSDCRLFGYMVHFGDWPYPQGYRPERYSAPPSALMDIGYKWYKLPLSSEEVATKNQALGQYKSQLQLCERFLRSFVRTNEQFAQLPLTITASRPVMCKEPINEDLMPMLQPGADIKSVSFYRNKNDLDVTLYLKERASKGARYRCVVRALNDRSFPPNMVYSQDVSTGMKTQNSTNQIKFQFTDVPSQPLLGVTATSYVAQVKVDKIMERFIQ
ncbi:MAG: PIG-L deacetylase family protein [Armatimonadota bacterium]